MGVGVPCRFLQDGRLFSCPMAALVHIFNDRYGFEIVPDEGVDIHSPSATGRRIIAKLYRPLETCRWCTSRFSHYLWELSNDVPEDWDTETQKAR